MSRFLLRLGIIFFIVYASMFGGVVENSPLMKVVHQVGSALLIGGWLIHLARHKRAFPITRLDWPLWGMGLAWLISALLGETPRVSLEYVWSTFFHIVLFFIVIDLFQNGHRQTVMEGLFIMGGIIVILSALEMTLWYFGSPYLTPFWQGWPPLGGYTLPPTLHEVSFPLNYNNPTGAYAVLLIPLALAWGNTKQQADLRWGLRFLAGSLTVVAILTQSRGAYLGLVALMGFMLLIWLMRPDTRRRLPARWQPFLDPRLILAVAGVAALIAVIILFQIIIYPDQPNDNDAARLSLWLSSVQMFEDHMWTGVGPYQFKLMQLSYGNTERPYDLIPLNHAHNLFFTVLAEGGVIVLLASAWVIVRFGRMWWAAWVHDSERNRRRLEGILAALLAFAVHNMVDAFHQTQFMIPLMIMIGFVAVRDGAESAVPTKMEPMQANRVHASRVRFALTSAVLIVSQIIAIPILIGAIAQSGVNRAYNNENYAKALDKIRDAKAADPWFDYYDFEEAMILGALAQEDPALYLTNAIAAFEKSVRMNDVGDIGWHNLAALYAQSGDYEQAIATQEKVIDLNPWGKGYYFKLGEYHELAGHETAAFDAYSTALNRRPWLAASPFWADPDYPTRPKLLADIVAATEPLSHQIPLAFYAGAIDLLRDLRTAPDFDDYDSAARDQLNALFPDETLEPCATCLYMYYDETFLPIEIALHRGNLTPDELAAFDDDVRRAIFISEGHNGWAWYTLARLTEISAEDNADDDVKYFLSRSVGLPVDNRLGINQIYKMNGIMGFLPQARVPIISAITYQPWLDLLDRHLADDDLDQAEALCKSIARVDPFAQTPCTTLPAQ